jgi:hypothetical protein
MIGKKENNLRNPLFIFTFIISFLAMALLLADQAVASEPKLITSQDYFLIEQDNPSFAKPIKNPDESNPLWQKHQFNRLPLSNSIVWVQTEFELPDDQNKAMGLLVSVLGSFEAYWDGQYIGSNGKVGDSVNSEIPGTIDKILLLPTNSATKDKHTLSLRISTQHNPKHIQQVSFFAVVSEYEYLALIPYKRASLPLIMTSALLLFAVYAFIIYLKSFQRVSYLIFSALSLCILMLLLVESWRGISPYTYDWQIPRLQLVLGLSSVISLLFTAFFAWFFEFSKRVRISWLALATVSQIIILFFVDGYDIPSLYVFFVGLCCATALCLQALVTKQKHALVMLISLAVFTVPIFINRFSYMDHYFFMSFGALIALMLYTLAQTMSNKQKELIDSQITATRLELELVKRNLQPHFILNTLTAVEEWIEESPSTAVNFIQALADEFRFMAQLSAQKAVRLEDEIDLCHSHLKVMSFRTNTQFSLVTTIDNANASIPPGVLLTLIENAMSHNRYVSGETTFTLRQSILGDTQSIVFIAPVAAIKNAQDSKRISLGIGNQYIHARLKERFANKWDMQSQLEEERWQVTLTTPFSADTQQTESAFEAQDKTAKNV